MRDLAQREEEVGRDEGEFWHKRFRGEDTSQIEETIENGIKEIHRLRALAH